MFFQVAVFDTAFHRSMPELARRYAVPRELYVKYGIQRYGFHGTSHKYAATRAAQAMGRPLASLRLVTLHLGAGCSAAAVAKGVSLDTSMGLTPLEGLMMARRSGDLDPAIVAFLAEKSDSDSSDVLRILNEDSGFMGVTGTADVSQVTQRAAEGCPLARLALDMFCYRVAKYVSSYVVTLAGLDAVIFTAGIGENSAGIRAIILALLAPLGFELDTERNDQHGKSHRGLITKDTSSRSAWVVPADEALAIAMETALVLASRK